MKQMTLLLLTLLSIFACKDEDAPALTKADYLTSGTQKSWYIYSATPDGVCGSASDDTWIFLSNGTFTYNHGTITEDAANQCSDLVNLEGTWQFSNNENTITIIALREAGSSTDNLSLTLVQGTIASLDNDHLVISTTSNNVQYSTEFRTK